MPDARFYLSRAKLEKLVAMESPLDFDENGVRISISASLWKLKKGMLGASSWRRRWCTSDGHKLTIWSGETIHDGEEKNDYVLYNSKPEELTSEEVGRKNTFRIKEYHTNRTVVLACDSAQQLTSWLDFLAAENDYDATLKLVHEDNAAKAERDLKQLEEIEQWEKENSARIEKISHGQIIEKFFSENDISGGGGEGYVSSNDYVISSDNLEELLGALSQNNPLLIDLVKLDLDSRNSMKMSDFLEYWAHYYLNSETTMKQGSIRTTSNIGSDIMNKKSKELHEDILLRDAFNRSLHRKDNNITSYSNDSSILNAGIIGSDLRNTSVSKNELVNTVIPDIPSLLSLNFDVYEIPFEHEGDHVANFEWNDTHQHLLHQVSHVYVPKMNMFSSDDEQTISENNSKIEENIHTSLDHLAFQSNFYKSAVEGARIIIDEYTLPDELKTVRSVDRMVKNQQNYLQKVVDEMKSAGEYTATNSEMKSKSGSSYLDTMTNASKDEETTKRPLSLSVNEYIVSRGGKDLHLIDMKNSEDSRTSLDDEDEELSINESSRSIISDEEETELHKFEIRKEEMGHEELFSYRGLQFRICAAGVDANLDEYPTSSRVHTLVATDNLLQKVAGNELRSSQVVQNAIESVYREQLRVFVEHHDVSSKDEDFMKPRTILQTVVDYGGFRVLVSCPIDINEKETLVHGFSSIPISSTLDNYSESNSSVNGNIYDAEEKTLFVDAYPPLHGLLPKLALQMNISMSQRFCDRTRYELTNPVPDPELAQVEILSYGMEAHKTEDDSIYLMNFADLLPPDLPRAETYDTITRRLRPEYLLQNKNRRINGDIFRKANLKVAGSGNLHADENNGSESNTLQEVDDCIKLGTDLYTKLIPELAQLLDSCVELPFDSYSLTKCFHSFGVNMRHMGIVYKLCKADHIKKLILSESIARSIKTSLSIELRKIARAGKAQSMQAEKRKRSDTDNYIEQQEHVLKEKRHFILNMFNLALRPSRESSQFWTTVLPDVVFQKFGIELPVNSIPPMNKHMLVHIPQLFLALQYHTGVIFQDHCQYSFENNDEIVFEEKDISNFGLPLTNLQEVNAGYVGRVNALAESYLASNINHQAMSLYRLRLSKLLQTQIYSCKETFETMDVIYKLALSMCQAEHYQMAIDLIELEISNGRKYTSIMGRMFTLLMYAQFKNKNIKEALESYDAGYAIYSYTLGMSHPIIAMHTCCLADLYFDGKYKMAALATMTIALDHISKELNATESHILTASYLYKTACLHIRIVSSTSSSDDINDVNDFKQDSAAHKHQVDALEYLTDAIYIYNDLEKQGAGVIVEKLNCLNALAVLYKRMGQYDSAFEEANKTYEIVKTSFRGEEIPQSAISTLFLFSELLVLRRNKENQALDVLQIIWNSVKSVPSAFYNDMGNIYSQLTTRFFSAMFSILPLSTRTLIETIAAEVESAKDAAHGIEVAGAWSKAFHAVCDGMWNNNPKEYFKTLIDGIMREEIEFHNDMESIHETRSSIMLKVSMTNNEEEAQEEEKFSRKGIDLKEEMVESKYTSKLNLLALQAAVIIRLIKK